MKNILYTLLLISVCGLHALATPLDDKIKAFDDALKTANIPGSSDPMFAERMAQQFGGSVAIGQEANLEAMVRQMMISNPSKAVERAGQALLDELQSRQKARLDEVTAKIDAVLAPVPDVVAKAEKPADLDAILASLQRLMPSNMGGYGYDPAVQAENARLAAAYQFVSQWQDYLSYRDTQNTQQEINTLRNLLNNNAGGLTIVPRSEILARIAPLDAQVQAGNVPRPYVQPQPPDIAPLLDGVKSLDDLAPAIRQVELLPNNQGYDAAELRQLAFLYGQAKNGLPLSLDTSPNYINGTAHPAVSRIESMVLLYVLPRLLGPGAPPPNANEQVNDYLVRTITVAEAAQNWTLLQRVLDAQMKIARVQPQTLQGTQNFLAGLNQEMAAQYARAVADYESALTQPDAFTPPRLIADRLAAIKQDHAADYDEGMKTFLRPPVPSYPPGYLNFNPYLMRYGMPGNPALHAPPPSVVAPPAPQVPAPTARTNPPTATPPTSAK